MRGNLIRGLALGLAVAIILGLAVDGSIGSADNMSDKPLAGVTLSLDKYCEAIISQAIKATVEKVKEAAKNEQDAVSDEEKTLSLNLVYDRLGIASKVDTYLNVRKKPNEEATIVGKLTKNAGCNVYKIKNGWAKIVSGKVNGWVKAEYIVTDEEAEELSLKVGTRMATVNTETLNARALPSTDARIYTLLSQEEEYEVAKLNLTEEYVNKYMEKHIKKDDEMRTTVDMTAMLQDLDNWMCIRVDNDKVFVAKEFIEQSYKLERAVAVQQDPLTGEIIEIGGSSSEGSGIGSSLVAYAMQFLGNPYVYGGTSLTNGTDCSGFTMRIYEHFGYYLPRVAADQAGATTSVSSENVRPGDLFFYGSGGYINHVAMYIGNGQVIHASNERTGIKISYAYYRTPVKIGRVIN